MRGARRRRALRLGAALGIAAGLGAPCDARAGGVRASGATEGGSAPSGPSAPNVVFAEALGSGLLYSVNYERRLPWFELGLRAGASFFTYAVSSYGGSGNLVLVSFPLQVTYDPSFSARYPAHRLHAALGATVLYLDAASDSRGTSFGGDGAGLGVAAAGALGYRFLPPDGGFTFAVAFTPLVRPTGFLPWGGASAGWAF